MPDYNQLQTDIADFMARSDLPEAGLISLAETELNRILRVQAMEDMSTATPEFQTPDGLFYLTFPTDYLELRHIECCGQRIDYRSPHQISPDSDLVYSIANELFLFPGNSEVHIYYYRKIPALSAQNLTNWFTDNAYDALLYLSLHHAGQYIKEPNDYATQAYTYIANIQLADDQASMSGSPLVQRG